MKKSIDSRVVPIFLLLTYMLALSSIIPVGMVQKAGAAGTVAFGSATTASTGSGQANSLTINKPSTTVSGDLLVAVIMIEAQNPTITLPSGTGGTWNNFPTTVKFTIGTSNTMMAAYYAIANGSEPASYTFSGGTNTQWVGSITNYKGVNTTTPIEAQSSTNFGAGGTTATALTVTPSTNNARVVSVFGAEQDAQVTFTPQAGINERFDDGSVRPGVGNADVSISAADISKYSIAATGSKTATISATSTNWGGFQYVLKPDGVVRMLLFWDGGAAPTGWSIIDDYYGMYPRGETPANFGVTGGGLTHTPSVSSVGQNYVNGANSNNLSGAGNNGNFWSSQGHNHGGTVTVGSANHEPAYRTLKLIRYDGGVPNTIPANAIAIFDGDPGMPATGWTDLSEISSDPFYQRVIKLDSTAGTNGGSDTHTHTLTWSSLAATTGQSEGVNPVLVNGTPATVSHTHTAPAGTSTASMTALPDYIVPQLAKAGADTATISVGITAMFDGDPGGGWVVRSKSSGTALETPFYQKFLRPGPTYSAVTSCTTQGCNTHSHSPSTSGNSGTNVGAGGNNSNLNLSIPPAIAGNGHAHTLTANFNANTDNTLPYFNIVIAEKVNFIMQKFFWYNDNDSVDLSTPATLPWGNPNIAESVGIIALPLVPSDPPDLTRELRLRVQILINGNNLAADVVRYKLQFNASLSTSCTASTGTWTDVAENSSTTAEWRFASSTPAGESSLTQSVFSPASTVLGKYVKSNSGTNNNPSATIGDTIEYDFHIQHNAAGGGTRYAFRIIESTGTLLSQYDACPSLITYPRTENQMRHGNFFLGGTPGTSTTGSQEQGFSWND